MNTAQNLADRYGVSKAAILAFVKSNLEIINKDGCNAFQTGTKKSWEFTDEAVRIIDKLRNVSSSVAERSADAERVIELQQEISTLKTALLLAQKETSEHKSKIIMLLETAPKELAAAQSDLAVAQNNLVVLQREVDILRIEKAESEAKSAAELKAKEEENAALQQMVALQNEQNQLQREASEKRISELQAELESEKAKSWWGKLWGR